MSSRSIESEVTSIIQPGDWVRADFIGNNWAAIFEKNDSQREESQALGYAYTPLLSPYSNYMENVWETCLEAEN